MMPEIDGIEACARIRNDPRYVDVPIIMVTSLDDMDSLANAFVAGATDYITKPLNRVELLARVRSALKLKAELDRRQARERELLQFMSTWGDRRASIWIDETTGLFVGEVAEAYLVAATHFRSDSETSVIALAVDRLDAVRSTQGDMAVAGILARVARAVQGDRRQRRRRRGSLSQRRDRTRRPGTAVQGGRASLARRCAPRSPSCASPTRNRSPPTMSPRASPS